jgi:integrase
MNQHEVKKLRKALDAVESEVLAQYPGLKDWTEPVKQLVVEVAKSEQVTGQPVEVPRGKLNALIKELAGEPPYPAEKEARLRRLNEFLFARWHAAGLAVVPAPAIPMDFTPKSAAGFQHGDEKMVHAFDRLWRFLLSHKLNPEKASGPRVGLSREDHRACALIMSLLASGDMLVSSPAHALARFHLDNLDFGPPWTMVSWYRKGEYRWPLSWVSVTHLMKLLALIPKRDRPGSYFFGNKYYRVGKPSEGSRRVPVKTVGGKILLHDVFNRWLSWLGGFFSRQGASLPVQLTLRTAVKAARRRASLVHAEAVVQYLSGKLPAACQDEASWRALLHGEREAFAQIDEPRSSPVVSRPHSDGKAVALTASDHDYADQVMQKALSIIQVGHNKKKNKSHIRAQLKQLAGEHERIPPRDGKAAFRGSLRGALIYLAYRVSQDNITLETLEGEIPRLQDMVCSLFGAQSLALLTGEDVTALAAEYMAVSDSPHTQRHQRDLFKRFWKVIAALREEVLEDGLELAAPDWNSPEVRISWTRKARTVVTPKELGELIAGVEDEKLRPSLTLLACLGYYCTMREAEALSVTPLNCRPTVAGREVRLTYSKTPSGLRSLPVSLMVPLPHWVVVDRLLADSAGKGKGAELAPDMDRALNSLEHRLAKAAGASFHTLRHSAATMLVLKLCLVQNLSGDEPCSQDLEALRARLEEIHGEEFSREALLELGQGLLGEGSRAQPMTIPLVSKLMGHLEPSVTVQVYLHVVELLAAHSRDLMEWPDMNQQQAVALTEASPTTMNDQLGVSGGAKYSHRQIALWVAARYLPDKMFGMG